MGDDGKIDITVNDKPVVLEGTKQTGASVKKAAIEQDVNIKADFVLSIELGGGKTELKGMIRRSRYTTAIVSWRSRTTTTHEYDHPSSGEGHRGD